MKRKNLFIILLPVLLLLLFVGRATVFSRQAVITRTVCKNQTQLLQYIEAGEPRRSEQLHGIRIVRTYPEGLVEFCCDGMGLGSATSYYGFYYAPDGRMDALWCAGTPLVSHGQGWLYEEKGGDNRYYTEHITGDFYYYEASF